MPIYEYVCDVCGKSQERLVSFKNVQEFIPCPCGGSAHKVISAPAFHLKGNGWYESDYKKASKQESQKETEKPKGGEKVVECPAKTDSTECKACCNSVA
jgi:putative FmdB family regulatory protein